MNAVSFHSLLLLRCEFCEAKKWQEMVLVLLCLQSLVRLVRILLVRTINSIKCIKHCTHKCMKMLNLCNYVKHHLSLPSTHSHRRRSDGKTTRSSSVVGSGTPMQSRCFSTHICVDVASIAISLVSHFERKEKSSGIIEASDGHMCADVDEQTSE